MITGNASLKVNGKTPSEEERQGMNMQQDEGPDQALLLILFPLGLLAGIGLWLSQRLTPAGIAGIVAIVAAMLQLALGFPLENIQPCGGDPATEFGVSRASTTSNMGQLQQPAEPTFAGVPRAHRSSPPSDGLNLTLVQLEGTAPELEPAAPTEDQVPLELESGQDPEDTEIFAGEVTVHTIDETDAIELHLVQPELNGSGMEETVFSVTEDFGEMNDMMGDAMGDMMMSQAFEKKVEPFFWISNLVALVGAVLCFVVANQIKPTSVPQPSTSTPASETSNSQP